MEEIAAETRAGKRARERTKDDGTRVEKRSEGGSIMTRRRRPEITAGMRVQ